jgi:hypothetical protein
VDPYEPGKCFFHYTTREAAFEHILPSGKLRLSSLDEMRDPLENKAPGYQTDVKVRRGKSSAVQDFRTFASFGYIADEIRASARLLALTVDADGYPPEPPEAAEFARGWSRARMWEHYAEKHAGVCLIFDRNGLTEAVTRSLRDQGLS